MKLKGIFLSIYMEGGDNMKKLVIALMLVTLVFQGAAYAKLVGGKVVSTDAAANTVTIGQTNPETGANENVTVWVNDKTTYAGVDSLSGINADAEVWIDAEEDAATKNWIATSVQLLEAPAAPAAAEALPVTQ